jgi:porin
MRLPSLFTRYTRSIIVALLAVAAIESTARAQQFGDPRRAISSRPTTALDREPSEAGPNSDSPAEATPEAETPLPFGGPILERPKLTGDWLGCRSGLRDHGVTLDVSSTQFYQGVASGGLEQSFQYGGRNDYFLNLEGEKLCLWHGASLTLHGETRYGESVSSIAGTLLAPNLMLTLPQPSGSVTALTCVTLTQSLSDEMEVYAGKINTLDGFKQPLTGAGNLSGFQNTAMLYNPVYARTVPYSTFGVGFDWLQNNEPVFSACLYDTNDSPTTSGFDTFFDNGVTVLAELSLATKFFDLPGHQGIGGTYSNGKYTDLTPSSYLDPIEGLVIMPTLKTGSWCLAYNFDQALYVSPEDAQRMWGVFGNLGIADSNPSPVRWFATAGISGASQIPGRKADTFGVAYFYLGVSQPLKDLAPILLPLRDEDGVELYYNVVVTPWCQITPDVQVITPFRDRADTALLFGLRANVEF